MTDLASRLADLPPKKRELLLRKLGKGAAEQGAQIVRQPRTTNRFPLSFSQVREWILAQLDPGSAAYNIPGGSRIVGPFDPAVFRRAVAEIVRRHETLRTTIEASGGEPVQVIAAHGDDSVPLVDLSTLPEASRQAESRRITAFERGRSFDLARGPLLRVLLLRLADEEHAGIFTMHHIISDGWSVGVLMRELAVLCRAFAQGLPSPLPELPIQYADFAVWQREALSGEVLETQVSYWREQLAGAPPLLALPTDRPRPTVQGSRGHHHHFAIDGATADATRYLAHENGASFFMVILAVLQSLLARWSGEPDVPVGTYTGSRGRAELEDLIGFFVNTLVLRTRLDDVPAFSQLLARVRETTLAAFAHQDLPFEKLLEELKVERSLAHTPLFQVLLLLQNLPGQAPSTGAVRLQPLDEETAEVTHVNFDLSVVLGETESEVRGALGYNLDLFDEATIERLEGHFQTLLRAVVAAPERPVHEHELLSPAERETVLVTLSGHDRKRAEDLLPVHRLFAEQAGRTPDRIAVEQGEARLSYGEVEEGSNRWAHRLRGLGVGPETLVGVAAERSPQALVALLGVLKAGGAYVPLDPSYPADRLAWMVNDAKVRVVLTDSATSVPGRETVQLDEPSDFPTEPLHVEVDLDQLAYVIYTSGSTGRPKGVAVSHRSLAGYTHDAMGAYGIQAGDRALQFASWSFDTSAEEIFPALAGGATLVLRSASMLDSVACFVEEVERLGITVLNLPTAYWHELSSAPLPRCLHRIVIGGEQAQAEALLRFREANPGHPVHVVNTYGPTEATIVATRLELAEVAEPRHGVPIGRPIDGARTYVVDPWLAPVPLGVAGELLIGGPGLARGYLDRPDLTASAFVPDPFGDQPGARLYRTGDRVRLRPNGRLEFLGRLDGQIKLRGFRIELGEIESALVGHPSLHAAAAALVDGRLVGYAVPQEGAASPTTSELRSFLGARLPEHMLPAVFMTLPSLPRTGSGKIDRRALPKPQGDRPTLERPFTPPTTEVEEALAALWGEALSLDRVGITDNFFELGGHSLLATQVIARIKERLGVEIPLIALFQMPTVEQLAVTVEEVLLDQLEALHEEEVRGMLASSPRR